MGRSIPRFLLSHVSNTKTKGTFIVHTLDPGFVAEIVLDEARQIQEIEIIKVFESGSYYKEEARSIADQQIRDWWKYSGMSLSCDPRDKIISKLSSFAFLKDNSTEFSVDEAREMIRVAYPTKAKRIYSEVNSNGIKHDFERISGLFLKGATKKYCTRQTVEEAFAKEGFEVRTESDGNTFNISEKECSRFRKLCFFIANNPIKNF